MGTSEIARLFKAKRVAKGKWVAKCPAHRDKTPSLGIGEGKVFGTTVIKCMAGCATKDVLLSVGLGFSDLFPESKIDYTALRMTEEARIKREADKQSVRRIRLKAWRLRDGWRERVRKVGDMLAKNPENERLADSLHYAIEMERKCDAIGASLL